MGKLKTRTHKDASQATSFKSTLRRVWRFLWEDDGWASWFVSIIIAFILIKFVVYPGLGLIFGTTHPIVAVVSSSMEHDGDFETWWASPARCNTGDICTQSTLYSEKQITKEEFQNFRFWNGFNKGDLMILFKANPDNINIGDVIVFYGGRSDPIIHRTISITEINGHKIFKTKGDHNPTTLSFEDNITENNLVGKAVIRLPYLGYVKIIFVKLLSLIGITGG